MKRKMNSGWCRFGKVLVVIACLGTATLSHADEKTNPVPLTSQPCDLFRYSKSTRRSDIRGKDVPIFVATYMTKDSLAQVRKYYDELMLPNVEAMSQKDKATFTKEGCFTMDDYFSYHETDIDSKHPMYIYATNYSRTVVTFAEESDQSVLITVVFTLGGTEVRKQK